MQPKKNWPSLLAELRDLCATRCTGTFLIFATGNHLVQFVLDQGEIIALSYNSKSGAEALPLIRQITMGSSRFDQRTILSAKAPLASTATLLAALDGSATSPDHPTTSSGIQGGRTDRAREVPTRPGAHTVRALQAKRDTVVPPVDGRAAVCQLISEVMNSLIDQFGDHGFGRDNLLKILVHRLRRLQTQYPFLAQVVMMAGKMDFTPLAASSEPMESLAQAWSTLIQEVYQSALDNLGRKTTEGYYRQVYDTYSARAQEVWTQAGVPNPLPHF